VKEYGDNVILIEPMATVQAVADYLASRVKAENLKDSTSKLTKSSDSVVETMEIEEPIQEEKEVTWVGIRGNDFVERVFR
jgi:hypothetical protein